MKLSILLTCIFSFNLMASVYSQKTRFDLDIKDQTVRDILKTIENESLFRFFYNDEFTDLDKKLTFSTSDQPIDSLMSLVLDNTEVSYKVLDNNFIVITPKLLLQQGKITGTVTGKDGTPLPGVNIVVTGTTQGAVSDINGNYSIEVPQGSKSLTFTFIGMEPQEISIGASTQINLSMKESAVGLEEVVVVGYGSQKKRDVIGSISTIKSAVLETTSGSTNFNSLIQGQAAGVSVQSTSGRLGANVDIKIRGLSSISADTDPLWIIDGIPVHTGLTVVNHSSAPQSPMQMINQSDIASIEVLKDAAATSIYGSRGSNGVIIVTTKTGGIGKPSFNLDYTAGFSVLPFQRVDFLNTDQWFAIKDKSKQDYGLGDYNMNDYYSQRPYSTEFLTLEQAKSINTDWRKATMQTGNFQSLNLSANGGDKSARYFISGNYRKDNGVMTTDYLERYGLRANLDFKPLKSLDIGTKINLSLSNSSRGKNDTNMDGNQEGYSGGFGYVNANTVPFEPVYSLSNPNQYYNPLQGNPVASSDPRYLKEELQTFRALTSLYGEYFAPFIKGLSLRTELSMDFIQTNRNFWVSDVIRERGSMGHDNASTDRTVNYNLFLKYYKTFGSHNLDLVGGTESQMGNTWFRRMEGINLVGTYQELGTPAQVTYINSELSDESYLRSYFARANYKFKSKYLAGISLRRDGSSVFTADYRWGNFIALSAGWVFSDESFMGEFGKKNFLKIRSSYGQTGNASIPSNLNASQYEVFTQISDTYHTYGGPEIYGSNGVVLSSIGVSNLTWESTNNLDVGLDFGFFNHRIDGSLAYYNKYVKDLLLATSLPPSSGISSIWGNIGDLVNSGIELSLTSSNLASGNLKWQTSLNIAFNNNEVKKLTPEVDESGAGMIEECFITKVGYGVREFYMADWAGVDPQTGLGMIYALDKETLLNTGETKRLKDSEGKDILLIATNPDVNDNKFHIKGKSTMPKYYGGINNKFTYKGFDFGFLITFSGGNYIFDNHYRNHVAPSSTGEFLSAAENYWKEPGDNAEFQRLDWKGNIRLEDGTEIGMGDYRTDKTQFLFKGDYIKLKSINFGYTLPITSASNKFLNGLRLYASVENLYTLTKYPGWDPEGLGDVNQWDLPQLFSASIGVNITF